MSTFRVSRVLIAGLLVLILLWVAGAGLLLSRRAGSVFLADQAIDPELSARPGVNLSSAELSPEILPARLDELSRAGIRFVRFAIPWNEVEPERGSFGWARWDAVAEAFGSRPELTPVVVLNGSPEWARRAVDAENPLAPPQERQDFGSFARAVAERYGDKLRYYQVWDEPNISPHWGTKNADPQDYLGLLREGAINIRAADEDAKIISAALAPTAEAGGSNLSDVIFLDQLYAAGGRAWFDYPAAQPYGFGAPPDAPTDIGQLNFARSWLLRDVMLRHGDGNTALWASAFGWNAGDEGAFDAVTEDQQAAYTEQAFEKSAREWPWLGPLLWTNRFAAAPVTQRALAAAASPPAVLGPGAHAPNHPALRYSGGWRATALAADPGSTGDTLEFAFDGQGLALTVQGGPYWAYLSATIDGEPANRLPRDESGEAYLVLHDPGGSTRTVTLADELPPGEHTVRLTATGGWGQWPLRAVVVAARAADPMTTGAARYAWLLLALAAAGTAVWAVFAWRAWGTTVSLREQRRPASPLPRAPSFTRTDLLRFAAASVLALAFHLSGSGTVNFAVLALFGLLFLIDPGLAPPLIAASLPFWQRTQPVLRWEFALFEVLAWVAVLAWIGRGALTWLRGQASNASSVRSPQVDGLARSLDVTLIALVAAGLLATILASEQGVAWREFRIVFLFGLVFYALITRGGVALRRETISPLVAGLLAGAVIASMAGIWQLATGQGRVEVEGVGRIAAFYGSPNNLALVLDRAVPLALSLALFGGGKTTGASGVIRSLILVVAVVCFVAAIATFSKGAILLGLPVGIALVLLGGAWRARKRWPLLALLVLVVLGAGGLLILFETPRFADLFNFQTGTTFFRVKLWQGAWNMALDHPVVGVGPDNFLYAYRTRYVLPSAWEELNLSHPHNILLDLWTRLGMIGVAAGIPALTAAFVAGWRLFRPPARATDSAPDAWRWPLALGLLGGLAAAVTHGLIDNSLFLPDLMGWFVAATGIFWLLLRREDD